MRAPLPCTTFRASCSGSFAMSIGRSVLSAVSTAGRAACARASFGPVMSVAVFASSSRPMMKYRGFFGDTKATFGPIHTS